MPVSVPTSDEFQSALATVQGQLDMLNGMVGDLNARVTALEAGTDPTPPDPPNPPLTTGRACIITIGSQAHSFTQEAGTDLGDYVDLEGRFTQHCIASRCDTLPDWTVFFRPDADGKREEVVVEFGRCHNAADQQYNGQAGVIPAYTVELRRDDAVLATLNVPKHYLYSRWRWQSAPRPVTVTVADLIARKLVPPIDGRLLPGMRAQVHADDGPMMPNGIATYMGMTGERDDIGIITESQADYLIYEDDQALGTVRAWLEGGGCFPMHERDENTFAPIDFVNTYPMVTTYPNGYGEPQLPTYYTYEEEYSPDTAHRPELSYLPFLLTGDPYALEQLQFHTTYDYCAQSRTKDFCMDFALRGYAWHLRSVANCVVATPDNVPQWLQPKAYWQKYLDMALEYTRSISVQMGPDTWQQRFRDISVSLNSGGEVNCNMEEYAMSVYEYFVDLGMPGWEEIRNWKLPGVIARTDGKSGYNRSIPIAYVRQVACGSPTAAVCEDWKHLWDFNVQDDPTYYGDGDPTQAHLAPSVNLGYATQTTACLNWALRQGCSEATESQRWMTAEMTGRMQVLRWCVGATTGPGG